jgi:CTP:molybdopterin cytidylyltransferase MocA
MIPVMIGIVLAAGAGGRMGGPKARLIVNGDMLASLHVRRLREAGCDEVVVVLKEPLAIDATIAISSAPDPAGSLAVGLSAASGDPVIVTPVDVMPARVETIRALVLALGDSIDAATPVFRGANGHPVVIRRAAIAIGKPLRDVLAALGDRRTKIDVGDAAVATDLDTPEDVVAATGALPVFSK